MKKIENLFKSDSCSESAMPLTTEIGRLFDRSYGSVMSSDMSDCMKRYSELYEQFENSLDERQRELFETIGFIIGEPAQKDSCEHFNKGFRLGIMLMAEVLPVKAM